MMAQRTARIIRDEEVMGGEPVIEGTWIRMDHLNQVLSIVARSYMYNRPFATPLC